MGYAKFEMDGQEILVEVDSVVDAEIDSDAIAPGRFKAANPGSKPDSQVSPTKLSDAMKNTIAPNAAAILSACRSNGADPDEIEVSFGLKAGAEGGLAFFGIAKATAEANYSVTITWKKRDRELQLTPSPSPGNVPR